MSEIVVELPKPQAGVKYPLKVEYCGNCSMPTEFCKFYPDYDGCKAWLKKNLPDQFSQLDIGSDKEDGDEESKKRQKRGGKGMMKAKKKDADVEQKICLSIAPRGKKKAVTVVQGLKTFGVDLKVASKFFGQKFACGASITGDDEIVIQGDFKDDLFDLIPEKWPDVDEDLIDDLGEKKRS
uniref:Density-regulated protein n=1 Tax=Caligus rogercresseyi TaxID=217165 RepID=C1BMK7_CALRO|nr:Density-regulated protein [Caligus rogercresseyi]|eukprot:TRINITY_DN27_c0_g1_i1.p1 TRINITY_DN27_c0_g1~~TRINITY_DN27_c0_g1_i1.p1  ORF type:complete len:181 (+),score=74.43 TRINITY_DN27_c0_g1_i1:227-769(+)